jgi:hypothetical protein
MIDSSFSTLRVAVFAAVAAVALFATSAQAQEAPCGVPSDAAEDLLGLYMDELDDFFPMDPATCEKMAKTFFSACQGAVKSGIGCTRKQISSFLKAGKSACKLEGDLADECNASLESGVPNEQALQSEEGEGNANCFEAANAFFFNCIGEVL